MSRSDEENAPDTSSHEGTPRLRLKASHVQAYPRAYPVTLCDNYCPSHPTVPELEALNDLKNIWLRSSEVRETSPDDLWNGNGKEVVIFDLENFSIYEKRGFNQIQEWDLSPLHRLNARYLDQREVCSTMRFTGSLSVGTTVRTVQDITFDAFSVEGYDDSIDPSVTIFIQSQEAREDPVHDIWYRLTKPSEEYRSYFDTFLWISQFGKHFVDYLGESPPETVTLASFQRRFFKWVRARFKGISTFNKWKIQFRGTDFRQVVNAHLGFLFNQAGTLDNANELLSHPVWAECGSSSQRSDSSIESTVVTPYVLQFFKDLYFAEHLKELKPEETVAERMRARQEELGFHELRSSSHNKHKHKHKASSVNTDSLEIHAGDVVGLRPDPNGSWGKVDAEWIAYVQSTELKEDGDLELSVIYLYRPADTTISDVWYEHKNELFFSDNCNCDEPAYPEAVTRKYAVAWNPEPTDNITDKDFIVRQKYLSNEQEFMTLRNSDFVCRCRSFEGNEVHAKYRNGDCVYVETTRDRKTILEPAIVESYSKSENRFALRRLLRLHRDCGHLLGPEARDNIPPNELLWTNELFAASPKRIRRECHIRFFSIQEALTGRIPSPYNHGGAGDYWYIASVLSDGHEPSLEGLTAPLNVRINQGFDPRTPPPWKPLRGLSLFSGGGGLDRGLEEGGAVQFETAIDISKEAILTQSANALHPDKLHPLHASVNTVLKIALLGQTADGVPQIGEVDCVVGGSPCPGYSILQKNRFGEKPLRDASLVTTFLSFIDIYRPSYAILENVTNIAKIGKGLEGTKVLSSIISCLVSMGYQVKQFVLDAWNYGSIQRRSRIFLCAAAPGLTPLAQPMHTHSHYLGVGAHSLGLLPNGEKFAQREDYPTPFQHRTAAQALGDLPNIGSGALQACILLPDHRINARQNAVERATMERIPNATAIPTAEARKGIHLSQGPGFFAAIELGLIPDGLHKYSSAKETNCRTSKRFRRVKPDGLAPTITTHCHPRDSRTGDVVHWDQPRPLTIQDARRTQGIPDGEVIIGNTEKQWEIIGNGVDRNSSFPLGLSLRDSVAANHSQNNTFDLPTALERVIPERESEVIDLVSEPDAEGLHAKIKHFENGQWTSIPPEDQIQATLRASTEAAMSSRQREVASLPSPPDSHTASGSSTPIRGKRPRDHVSEGRMSLPTKRTRHSGLQADPLPTTWHRRVEHVLVKSRPSSVDPRSS